MKKIIWAILTITVISSCTHRILDFTLISSKNVDISKFNGFVKGKERVRGNDMVHWVIIFPTGTVSIKEALDRAIESKPGCVALLDGVIYSKFWLVPYIYGQQTLTIEGTPLIDPSNAQSSMGSPSYGKIELDKNGEIKKVEKIDSKEYLELKGKVAADSKSSRFSSSEDILR